MFLVNENWNIDWDVVNTYKEIKTKTPSEPLEVTESEYNLALVSPNYRALQSYYIVTMICDEITADSSFPTDDFYSYVHYFKDRHNLNIQNKKQPMLEVKPVSTRINCIKPRYVNYIRGKIRNLGNQRTFVEYFIHFMSFTKRYLKIKYHSFTLNKIQLLSRFDQQENFTICPTPIMVILQYSVEHQKLSDMYSYYLKKYSFTS